MIHIQANSADELWRHAVGEVRTRGTLQSSRLSSTHEIIHVASTIADPRQRVVFSRPISPAFAIAEVLWIMAGKNDLEFLRFWNKRMAEYSDDGTFLRGAYGHRLRRHFKVDQLMQAYSALREIPHSRQVVLQIWDAASDLPNPKPRHKDIPCNIASHLMIRDGKLEWLQVMRSNDLVLGLPYNIVQFTTMQEILAGWLEVDVGSYNHISDSLHVYEADWPEIVATDISPRPVPTNSADARLSLNHWQALWPKLVSTADRLSHCQKSEVDAVVDSFDGPPAYRQWITVLGAEAYRRHGQPGEADALIIGAGRFWSESWRRYAAWKERASGRIR